MIKTRWSKPITFILCGLLVAMPLVAAMLAGCSALPVREITKDEAIRILVSKIIKPAGAYDRISAYMLSEPLAAGDTVSSESGQSYAVSSRSWFVFIDDEPEAFFAHHTRYIFIDAANGNYEIKNESWPPEINTRSMWDSGLGKGHLIELYSVLDSSTPISGKDSSAPRGDYGDAPDGQDAYYGIPGRFPTLFATTNSKLGLPGAHALNTGLEMLGINVSAEIDATDPSDPDGVPNLVDSDSDERIFVILEGQQAKLAFTVTLAPHAPKSKRYANSLIDFDHSGNWSKGNLGDEWTVVNQVVSISPGSSETVLTPWFTWPNMSNLGLSPVWMRLALTRQEIKQSDFSAADGWYGSGQFAYGEIEDYFAFLTDKPALPHMAPLWPPPPPPPSSPPPPPPPPGGQPPGPKKGPCGYDINYHIIIISGGDTTKDLANGTPIVQASIDRMADLAKDQGYQTVANLGPGKGGSDDNTLANIGKAFENLAQNVKCGDYVLIYICGHGSEDGGISLKGSSGQTQETMKPTGKDGKGNSLADFLGKIPPCPDQDCNLPGSCCHVSVVIESCYAGNFNVPGVTGQGRSVIGTSNDTESWSTYPGGGVYTEGFDHDARDPAADTSQPPDGIVDTTEANKSAKESVEENNQKRGKAQEPWENNQTCECKCPCQPGIDGDKWVWDGISGKWVDQIYATRGQSVRFRLEIENSGKCRDIIEPEAVDLLPPCLEWAGQATLYRNGKRYGPGTPSQMIGTSQGIEISWDLADLAPLSPGENIAIEYLAIAQEPGINLNQFVTSAHCSYDYSKVVTDEDAAGVLVLSSEQPVGVPPVEQTLHASFEVSAHSQAVGPSCWSTVSISFQAQDITGGDYPVTSVILSVEGDTWHNSGSISTASYYAMESREANCGQILHIKLVATNSIGQIVTASDQVTTPIPLP